MKHYGPVDKADNRARYKEIGKIYLFTKFQNVTTKPRSGIRNPENKNCKQIASGSKFPKYLLIEDLFNILTRW